jgi:ATP-binding protein involved in chromosome partitioning
MVVTREQVLEALSTVQDPHYGRSLVELNLLRDVMVKADKVALSLITTVEEQSVLTRVKAEITDIISQLGITDIHIRERQIAAYETDEIAQKLGQPQAKKEKQELPHAAQARYDGASPLLSPESGVHFIAVASGKGGVGKSTVTVNLAVALARKGKKVGIIDADIYGFSVPDMMGVEERPELEGQTIIPVERFGVKIMSMGFFVQDNAPIIWRGPMLGKMLRNFFAEVNWGEVQYILLDLPPGTGDVALDVHQMIPHSREIIVTTPHATAAFVAARAGAMAVHTKHEILGVVENMAYYINKDGEKDYVFGRGGGAKLAEELHTEILAQIPLGAPDNHIAERDFSPSVYKEESATGQMYIEMAERIIAKIEA